MFTESRWNPNVHHENMKILFYYLWEKVKEEEEEEQKIRSGLSFNLKVLYSNQNKKNFFFFKEHKNIEKGKKKLFRLHIV